MSYEFKEITDEKTWKAFEENYHDNETFFQSWEWSEFEKSIHKEVYRIGIYDSQLNELAGVMSIVFINAKRGRLLHVRNGPLIKWGNKELAAEVINYLRLMAIDKDCSYVRISPLLDDIKENRQFMKELGLVSCQMHDVDAEITWVLNLNQSEEEILAGMRKNVRYYIGRAKKDGVQIIKSTNPDDLVKFWPIFLDTVERQSWKAYSYEYVFNEFKTFAQAGKALLILAKYDDKYIAGSIFIFHKGISYYHHSGSLTAYRKIPAPYLIQWQAIKEAKARGFDKYNFFGIARTDKKTHPWAGLTFFKKGFGGYAESHLHAHDLPIKNKYWLTHLFEFGERKLRGY